MAINSITKIFVTLLLSISIVNGFDENQMLKNEKIIKRINGSPTRTWKARYNFGKDVNPLEFIRTRTGLIEDEEDVEITGAESDAEQGPPIEQPINLPKNFDPRTRNICPIINTIRDQSNCGSCWAVSITSMLSDRLCVATNGNVNLNFSAHHLISCCRACGGGCNGGGLKSTYRYLTTNPLVTGGCYESDEGCQPYTIRPCGSDPSSYPCSIEEAMTPKCFKNKCTNEYYEYDTEQTSYKVKSYKRIRFNESEALADIFQYGSIVAAIDIKCDIYYYEKGVYIHDPTICGGQNYGQHAIRVIGWGETDKGLKYWIVANSWSRRWGENGYMLIRRGENEVGIEKSMYSAIIGV